MLKPGGFLKDVLLGLKNASMASENFSRIKLDKVLILSKLSRYEFEKHKTKIANDQLLEEELRNRGTDFEKLLHSHELHKKFEETVAEIFSKLGVDVEVVNRFDYTEEKANWADVIVPVGGDGTFLLAASKVRNNSKPVIGFNSDPTRSEGYLCLAKKYSLDVEEAVEKLQKGQFNWLLRSRIRIKLMNRRGAIIARHLHEPQDKLVPVNDPDSSRILPVLALNEVFVGETTSSRVSYLQMRLNGSIEQTSIKCSGVCVCTGTGSTSWHMSINRIPAQSVAELLALAQLSQNSEQDTDALASDIAETYNKRLIFDSDDMRMCYTIRDLISAGVWPNPKGIKPRDFVSKMEIKSNCYDASLVVDGGVSFDFNDGTIAFLETKIEDALRTVVLRD